VIEIPEFVTHRYDPSRGACLNLCSLSDFEASDELDRLRRGPRPTLKNNYLIRRRLTPEEWLAVAAREVLGRAVGKPPVYFLLGDFSHMADPSRPAALVIPLSSLPPSATTFTLASRCKYGISPRFCCLGFRSGRRLRTLGGRRWGLLCGRKRGDRGGRRCRGRWCGCFGGGGWRSGAGSGWLCGGPGGRLWAGVGGRGASC